MPTLRHFVTGVASAFITGAIMWWLGRDAAAAPTEGVLRYGKRMRALAALGVALALFVCYAASHASRDQRVLAALVATGFVVGTGWLAIEVFSFRGRVTDTHLIVRSAWRGVREIPWEAIEGYSFSDVNQWHVLHTRGYGKVRLSVLLQGLDRVAEKLEEQFDVASG